MIAPVSIAVEGPTDEAVARRLIAAAGCEGGPVYGRKGKPYLLGKLGGYNNAAAYAPWVVLVDLDQDSECAPPYRQYRLPCPAQYMCFRIAVHAVEAWLLADDMAIAGFLGISRKVVPANPETLTDPKLSLVGLASRSRRTAIREDMVPRPDSGAKVGPAYSTRLIEFVQRHWRPELAADRSESLRSAIDCIRRIALRAAP